MISFCDGEFAATRDQYGWTLTQWVDSQDKYGNPQKKARKSYHPTLEQVCKHVIDVQAGNARDAWQLRSWLHMAHKVLTKKAINDD